MDTPELMDSKVITKKVFLQFIKHFDDLENGLGDKFSGLLKLLSDGLEKLNASLLQISKVAEEAKRVYLALNKSLLLSDMVKNSLNEDITEFQAFNECPYPIIWDSFKAFLRGRLIEIASYKKKE